MGFCLLYRIYLTRVGRKLHYRKLRNIENSHVKPYQSLHFGEEGKGIELKIVPFLEDNYGYIMIDETTNTVALVDPADPDSFDEYLETYNISNIDMILTTHKHWDHSAGNQRLKDKFPNVLIYGSEEDRVDAGTNYVTDGDKIDFGTFEIEAILTPCHTVGHTVYVVRDIGKDKQDIAFTGDFLFMASGGMFFEGTPRQMQEGFDKFLSKCKPETKLLYGHEYALDDLKFAVFVDPENEAAFNKLQEVQEKYELKEVGLPGTIAEELTFNPFLRAETKSLMEITMTDDKLESLATLRKWKDAKKHQNKEDKKAI